MEKQPHYRGFKAMPFLIGNETFERLGSLGITVNLIIYLITMFNMTSIGAIKVVNVFTGTCNFGTLIGAFIADAYLGRYKVIGVTCIASFLGMLTLTMTSAFPSLRPPPCRGEICAGVSSGQLALLYSGLGLLVIGASGIRPCNLAFGVDQFNPKTSEGKRGINSFFTWYYLTYTFGMLVSVTVVVYVQSNVSWTLGFGIPTALMLLGCLFFFAGTRIYVKVLPEGSPFTSMVQTLVAAVKKRKLELPPQPSSSLFNHIPKDSINVQLAFTQKLRCLNKAAIVVPDDRFAADGSAAEPWRLRSVQQVEQLKCVIRALPMWIPEVIYFIVLTQMQTYTVLQSVQCDRRFGSSGFKIPPGAFTAFAWLTITLWLPIYDLLLVPLLRRITGKEQGLTLNQRMGTGLVLAVLTMVVSAVVENRRREIALTRPLLGVVPHKGGISAMSANWLIPQLALAGLSEAFYVIGVLEFLYKQFPENMKSVAMSLFCCGYGLASYLNSVLITAVNSTTKWLPDDLNHGRLEYFFYLIAAMETLNLLLFFVICAGRFVHKAPLTK